MLRTRRSSSRPALALALAVGAVVALGPRVAPANVAEQRSRLPPAARCEDPVTGVWKSHLYNERRGRWTVWLLTVRRTPGTSDGIEGTILNDSWHATAGESEPGTCAQHPWHFRVSMDAKGTFTGGRVAFSGTRFEVLPWPCAPIPSFRYNLDNFTGDVDPAIQEFQSVNNDGGSAVNEPAVFRRISCSEDPESEPAPKATPYVEPPPFFPPRSAGC
ncbi:MAG: hypothetical protein HY908_34515 [Myxococcales bacterium]|nr:hypothetical protein [Myxococcales bacterium]